MEERQLPLRRRTTTNAEQQMGTWDNQVATMAARLLHIALLVLVLALPAGANNSNDNTHDNTNTIPSQGFTELNPSFPKCPGSLLAITFVKCLPLQRIDLTDAAGDILYTLRAPSHQQDKYENNFTDNSDVWDYQQSLAVRLTYKSKAEDCRRTAVFPVPQQAESPLHIVLKTEYSLRVIGKVELSTKEECTTAQGDIVSYNTIVRNHFEQAEASVFGLAAPPHTPEFLQVKEVDHDAAYAQIKIDVFGKPLKEFDGFEGADLGTIRPGVEIPGGVGITPLEMPRCMGDFLFSHPGGEDDLESFTLLTVKGFQNKVVQTITHLADGTPIAHAHCAGNQRCEHIYRFKMPAGTDTNVYVIAKKVRGLNNKILTPSFAVPLDAECKKVHDKQKRDSGRIVIRDDPPDFGGGGRFRMESKEICEGQPFTIGIVSQKCKITAVKLVTAKGGKILDVADMDHQGYRYKDLQCKGKKNDDCWNKFTFNPDASLFKEGEQYKVKLEMSGCNSHSTKAFSPKKCSSKEAPEGTLKQEPLRIILHNDFLLMTNYICKDNWFTFSAKSQKCRIQGIDLRHVKTGRNVASTQHDVQGDFVESVPCQAKDECRNYFDLYVPGSVNHKDDYRVVMKLAKANDRFSSKFPIIDCKGLVLNGTLLQQPPVPGPRLGGAFTFLSNKACKGGFISVRVRGNKSTINWIKGLLVKIFTQILIAIATAFLPGIGQVVGALANAVRVAAVSTSAVKAAAVGTAAGVSAAKMGATLGKIGQKIHKLVDDIRDIVSSPKKVGALEYVSLTQNQKHTIYKVKYDHYGNSTMACNFMTDIGCNLIVDLYIDPDMSNKTDGYQVAARVDGIGMLRSRKFTIEDCGTNTDDLIKYYFRYPELYDKLKEQEEVLQKVSKSMVEWSKTAAEVTPLDIQTSVARVLSLQADVKDQRLTIGMMLDYGLTFGNDILQKTVIDVMGNPNNASTMIRTNAVLTQYLDKNLDNMINLKTFNGTESLDIDKDKIEELVKMYSGSYVFREQNDEEQENGNNNDGNDNGNNNNYGQESYQNNGEYGGQYQNNNYQNNNYQNNQDGYGNYQQNTGYNNAYGGNQYPTNNYGNAYGGNQYPNNNYQSNYNYNPGYNPGYSANYESSAYTAEDDTFEEPFEAKINLANGYGMGPI